MYNLLGFCFQLWDGLTLAMNTHDSFILDYTLAALAGCIAAIHIIFDN